MVKMVFCDFHLGVPIAMLTVALIPFLSVRGDEELREITFHDIAPLNYDYLRPPMVKGFPVFVNVNVVNLNIRSVDESDMSITVAVEVWQVWNDSRLSFPSWADSKDDHQLLDSSWISKLWHTNLFFPDAVDGRINNVIMPSSFFWMTRDSRIYFCCRLVLKLICEMNLVNFPHDEQKCGVRMASAIFSDGKVVMNWMKFRGKYRQFSSLHQFEIVRIDQGRCQLMVGPSNVSCLEKTVILRRRGGYYLINVYIPTVLIVIMSMLTFWIPADAVPARITLGVTSLLTIITKQYQAAMPSVSYIVGLNVWLSCCIGFVFCSLLEYAVVIGLGRRKTIELEGQPDTVHMVLLKANGTWTTKECWSNAKDKYSRGQRLDIFSRIFFPTCFLIFVISYWRYYS